MSEKSSSRRPPIIIVVEQPAQPSPPSDPTRGVVVRGQSLWLDDPALQARVVALSVIVCDELPQQVSQWRSPAMMKRSRQVLIQKKFGGVMSPPDPRKALPSPPAENDARMLEAFQFCRSRR